MEMFANNAQILFLLYSATGLYSIKMVPELFQATSKG